MYIYTRIIIYLQLPVTLLVEWQASIFVLPFAGGEQTYFEKQESTSQIQGLFNGLLH